MVLNNQPLSSSIDRGPRAVWRLTRASTPPAVLTDFVRASTPVEGPLSSFAWARWELWVPRQAPAARITTRSAKSAQTNWRRRWESNPCTGLCRPLPEPLGHVAVSGHDAATRTRPHTISPSPNTWRMSHVVVQGRCRNVGSFVARPTHSVRKPLRSRIDRRG
jgi:hypothetical protein